MPITAKELMQAPRFEGIGKFVYARAGSGDWGPTYTFEFLGTQVNVEATEMEVADPPLVGSMFFISGHIRSVQRSGTISFVPTEKRFLAKDADGLTEEQTFQYIQGLAIRGCCLVKEKKTSTVNRVTYLSAILEWQGCTFIFKNISPEIYNRIPTPVIGTKVGARVELTILLRQDRNQDGQVVMLQIPAITYITPDTVLTGSVPSAAASTPTGSGMAKPAATPAPAAAAPKV